MWIRSQCGEVLVELKENVVISKIIIHGKLKMTSETKGVVGYDEWVISVGNYDVGIYETKERALEVLDEIQNAICESEVWVRQRNIQGFENSYNKYKTIYEMPKE